MTSAATAVVGTTDAERDEFEKLFADLPDPRREPGSSPTPKPLGGARPAGKAKAAGAGAAVPKPSPQPA